MTDSKWDDVADEVNFNLEIDIDRFTALVGKDSNILDFGCGYGRIGDQLFAAGYTNICGLDSSKEMINRGKKEFPDLDLQYMPDKNIPFPDNHFDVVVSCAVFTCIDTEEERDFWINEIYRVLKPEGLCHLVEFSSERTRTFTSRFGVKMWYGSQEDLKNLMSNFTIQHDEVKHTNTMGGTPVMCYSALASKTT